MLGPESLGELELLKPQQSILSNEDCCMQTEDDVQIKNPQTRLLCVLCRLPGEYKITGRLIPY